MADRILIQVLGDGLVKSTTDPVSPENHQSAEAFLKFLAANLGGEQSITARGNAHSAHHHHDHVHTHEHGHSH
jgi:hypothetical protein